MPKLKVLSGSQVVKIFSELGFTLASQKGSHIKLRRVLKDGSAQIITISLHSELDKGTIKAIYRQALRYIPEETLKLYFYTK